ncbi:hypothetical protein [Salinibacillus kushneri]|nr:hypothetical protein [Salinibacillus kushneri]
MTKAAGDKGNTMNGVGRCSESVQLNQRDEGHFLSIAALFCPSSTL